jgi:hypothetical protein
MGFPRAGNKTLRRDKPGDDVVTGEAQFRTELRSGDVSAETICRARR